MPQRQHDVTTICWRCGRTQWHGDRPGRILWHCVVSSSGLSLALCDIIAQKVWCLSTSHAPSSVLYVDAKQTSCCIKYDVMYICLLASHDDAVSKSCDARCWLRKFVLLCWVLMFNGIRCVHSNVVEALLGSTWQRRITMMRQCMVTSSGYSWSLYNDVLYWRRICVVYFQVA